MQRKAFTRNGLNHYRITNKLGIEVALNLPDMSAIFVLNKERMAKKVQLGGKKTLSEYRCRNVIFLNISNLVTALCIPQRLTVDFVEFWTMKKYNYLFLTQWTKLQKFRWNIDSCTCFCFSLEKNAFTTGWVLKAECRCLFIAISCSGISYWYVAIFFTVLCAKRHVAQPVEKGCITYQTKERLIRKCKLYVESILSGALDSLASFVQDVIPAHAIQQLPKHGLKISEDQ